MDTSQVFFLLKWTDFVFFMEVKIKQQKKHLSFVFAAFQMYVFYA